MISSDARLERADDVRYRIVDGEGVVIRQRSAEALVLNEVGARILDMFDGQLTLAEIVIRLEAEYAVEAAQLERDTLHYARELVTAGLARVVE